MASIAITLNTYSHILPNMQDHVTRALEDALCCDGLQYGCSKRAGKRAQPSLLCGVLPANAAFSRWAMLDSNQRPPPCKGGALPLS